MSYVTFHYILRDMLFTGTTLPESTWLKIKEYLPNGEFYCAYGMTEVGWISQEPGNSAHISVGNIMAGAEMKILNEEGKKLGVGQQGELCIRFENCFLVRF